MPNRRLFPRARVMAVGGVRLGRSRRSASLKTAARKTTAPNACLSAGSGRSGFSLILAMVGLFGAVMLLVLIGTALIWIPVIAVFLIIAAVGGLIRRL